MSEVQWNERWVQAGNRREVAFPGVFARVEDGVDAGEDRSVLHTAKR